MTRANLQRTHRLGMAAVLGMEAYARSHNPAGLYDLVKLRASLLNRCRYCIDLHTRALEKRGETPERIAALAGDLPAAAFDARENAALALTDAVTRLGEDGVSDAVWNAAAAHFSEAELGNLLLGIATINVWNRIGVATRLEP